MAASISALPMGTDTQLVRGRWMLVTGSGFPASAQAVIYIGENSPNAPNAPLGCTPPGFLCRGDAMTDASGNLSAPVQVPQFGTPAGWYTVTVRAGVASPGNAAPGATTAIQLL